MRKIISFIFITTTIICHGQGLRNAIAQQGQVSSSLPEDVVEQFTLKAFPTVEGRGAETVGGRDGKLVIVNTLSSGNTGSYDASCDCYKGTFKWALERPFDKTITFTVGGVIDYSAAGILSLYYDSGDTIYNTTILGATAPRPGIIIYGTRFQFSDADVSDLIIRGITVLTGDSGTPGVEKGLNVRVADNVVFSDINVGWSYDQAADISTLQDKGGTKQRVLHIECDPGHNTGGIIGGSTSLIGTEAKYIGSSVSSTRNVYSHISHRFDNFATDNTGFIDIEGNIAYNFIARLVRGNCSPNLNHEDNYYIKGPSTSSDITNKLNKYSAAQDGGNTDCIVSPKIYTKSNIISEFFTNVNADNETIWQQFVTANGYTQNDPLPSGFFVGTKHPEGVAPITVEDYLTNYNDLVVNKNVGSRYYADSDGNPVKYILPFIEEYIDDIIAGTEDALLADTSLYVLPTLDSQTTPYLDSDDDSIPDAFEDAHGMNKNDYTDAMESDIEIWYFDDFTYKKHPGMKNREVYHAYVHGDFEPNMRPLIN